MTDETTTTAAGDGFASPFDHPPETPEPPRGTVLAYQRALPTAPPSEFRPVSEGRSSLSMDFTGGDR